MPLLIHTMKIYLASSWKNEDRVKFFAGMLREIGHEVDAFCDPSSGRFVFSFSQLPDVGTKNAKTIMDVPEVQYAFQEDKGWIDWSDVVILILPAGKSAHLEAGYAKGSGKKLIIYHHDFPLGEFDVMYGFADLITHHIGEIIDFLQRE